MRLKKCRCRCRYRVKDLPENHLLKVIGIRRGTDILIQSKQPLNGPIVVRVGNRSIAIDSDVAENIEVKELV